MAIIIYTYTLTETAWDDLGFVKSALCIILCHCAIIQTRHTHKAHHWLFTDSWWVQRAHHLLTTSHSSSVGMDGACSMTDCDSLLLTIFRPLPVSQWWSRVGCMLWSPTHAQSLWITEAILRICPTSGGLMVMLPVTLPTSIVLTKGLQLILHF